jgi:hypothetical protein
MLHHHLPSGWAVLRRAAAQNRPTTPYFDVAEMNRE